ncbi:hypothetical protein CC85DRAFT_118051 [Cutaneotrichosporon oleaginosum]|uniref:Uncharacterized protein n=1 Tax=Cutaneotrichosporon oleaginosum TaxID=879819 RepID=A0A0J0XKC4_9TREE|nr:uncharacterized protein CC85DRAFT_118051 [Cutaneotrichosporon oleaginosum]KLT41545.1 hypothetical protein CC85DRAFT_118051 [Cutaneotrichosporon oleaginosum]TXT09313.1 hypothetical protein COLE_03247 [Cutaneotrichosporon oleaginosum]
MLGQHLVQHSTLPHVTPTPPSPHSTLLERVTPSHCGRSHLSRPSSEPVPTFQRSNVPMFQKTARVSFRLPQSSMILCLWVGHRVSISPHRWRCSAGRAAECAVSRVFFTNCHSRATDKARSSLHCMAGGCMTCITCCCMTWQWAMAYGLRPTSYGPCYVPPATRRLSTLDSRQEGLGTPEPPRKWLRECAPLPCPIRQRCRRRTRRGTQCRHVVRNGACCSPDLTARPDLRQATQDERPGPRQP